MTASPRLGFTYLTSGQAAPETAVNEIGAYLESGSGHFIFKDRDLATPPGSPANGDCYLVAASPTGAWTGKAGKIAFYLSTAWVFITVIEGYTAWINDENVFVGYDGASWTTLAVASAGAFLQASNNLSDVANAGTSRTNLGATTLGSNLFTQTNPSAVTFPRYNADNSVSALSAAAFRTAIGAGTGTGSGDLVSTNNLSDVANAGTARTNLGLAIGTNVQAYSAVLANVASSTYDAALKPLEHIQIACSDDTTAITTGTAKATFRMPYAFTVTEVRASVNTAPTGSTILIDINESGTTILSTKLMIDATEKTSTTAATPYVISDASLADDAEITIDFDQVGSTISGKGVKVIIIGHRA